MRMLIIKLYCHLNYLHVIAKFHNENRISVDEENLAYVPDRSLINLGEQEFYVKVGEVMPPYDPISDKDLTASKSLNEFLIKLKEKMSAGWNSIPPLDPYKRFNIEIPITSLPLARGLLTLTTLVITEASQFNLDKVILRRDYPGGVFRLEVNNLTIPRIVIESHFKITINLPLFMHLSTFGNTVIVLNNYELTSTIGGRSDGMFGRSGETLLFESINKYSKSGNMQVSLKIKENLISKLLHWLNIDVWVAFLALKNDIQQCLGDGILSQLNDIAANFNGNKTQSLPSLPTYL